MGPQTLQCVKLRLLVRFSVNGVLTVAFVGLKNIPVADADGITSAIFEMLSGYLNMEKDAVALKLVGFGCDGASVNLGKKTGVVKKLKEQLHEGIIDIHCMAHRLELAYKDTMKDVGLYKKLEELLTLLYSFYHKSAKNRSELKTIFERLGTATAIPPRIGGTRWVAFLLNALQVLFKGYKAFLLHMQEVNIKENQSGFCLIFYFSFQLQDSRCDRSAKALGICRILKNEPLIQFALFMRDILQLLVKISLMAQKATSTVADVYETLSTVMSTIASFINR